MRLPAPRRGVSGILLLLIVAGCSAAPPSHPTPEPGPSAADSGAPSRPPVAASPRPRLGLEPRLERTACGFEYDGPREIECANLVVARNRGDTDTRSIRIAVAILRAAGDAPPEDPLVYIGGGPGAEVLAWVPAELTLYPELEARDLVVIDPRGVGLSRPRITCYELLGLADATLDEPVSFDEQRADVVKATQQCRYRMTAHQLDPGAYHSAAIADDLEDLRDILGYTALNVYGISYGTRIALEYARRYPAHTRSLVLDGVVPPDADLYADWAPNFWSALDDLFAACERSRRCARSHPDSRKLFLEQIGELNKRPIVLDVTFAGRPYTIAVDGEDLVFLVFLSMYDRSRFQDLPRELEHLARRKPALIENNSLLGIFQEYTAEAHYLSVMCAEYAPFTSLEDVAAGARDLDSRLADAFVDATQTALEQCAVWGVPPRTDDFAPVHSDVPTLLLSGELDPITPPIYAERVAATLPNSTHVVVPATGHGTLIGPEACPARVIASFLDDPLGEPNTRCLEKMPGLEFR